MIIIKLIDKERRRNAELFQIRKAGGSATFI